MESTRKALVVLSGGLDSTTVLHLITKRWHHLPGVSYGLDPEIQGGMRELSPYLPKNVYTLSFEYGQKHETQELWCAAQQCRIAGIPETNRHGGRSDSIFYAAMQGHSALVDKRVEVPNIQDVMGHPQPPTYVPFRNLQFLTEAAALAEALGCEAVYYGAQLHDQYGYWDTTIDFIEAVQRVWNLNRLHRIELRAPLATWTKAEIISTGLRLAVDYSKTWSCYRGPDEEGRACGVCPTCSERRKGFELAHYEDPIQYRA